MLSLQQAVIGSRRGDRGLTPAFRGPSAKGMRGAMAWALLLGLCSCAHAPPVELGVAVTGVCPVRGQEMYRDFLQRMVDDRLEEREAERRNVFVSEDEIDRGVAEIATQRGVSTSDMFDQERRRGYSEQQFRDEIRRHIREGKLIALQVRPQVRVTDDDAQAAYRRWAQEMREKQAVDVRILALRVPTTWTGPQGQARTALARDIVRRARSGEDFCRLIALYSDDVSTKDSCGSHGPQPLMNLLPSIQRAAQTLTTGSISDPIPISVGRDRVLVVLMPLGQAHVPPFEDVKNEMMQRALLDGIDCARKQWLDELRRNAHVDARL
jgi:parvulin-like peptidyl-prolyl isomerase